MGKQTKIDWCDSTWNPVTGCLHGCEYCYARRIAERFGSGFSKAPIMKEAEIFSIKEKPIANGKFLPYPFDFKPTFHRYALDVPQQWKTPKTIFVCSMADLFGRWVPDYWIKAVFDACEAAPQHRYLFLTKNPSRYIDLAEKNLLPRQHWYGYSATKQDQLWTFKHADECPCLNLFVSIEPIQEQMQPGFSTHTPADWVIIGAETGNRKGKTVPIKEWIDSIVMECEYTGRPVFMKESLRGIMGDDFRQEFPWDRKLNGGETSDGRRD